MKKSQIDRAIEKLEAKKAVLQLAIDELRAQQQAKPARAKKTKPMVLAPRDDVKAG